MILDTKSSGGWVAPSGARPVPGSPGQLYDIEKDPKETTNLYAQHPELVDELTAILRRYVERGRSTPGPAQANTDGISWPGLPWYQR